MAILSAMAKDVDIGMPFTTYFLAKVRLLIISAKLKRIHDRLMGGPAKETKREPKPQPLSQGGGFRKTGRSLLIIIARG